MTPLLIYGLLRTVCWLVGAREAVRRRNHRHLLGMGTLACTSTIYSFTNAGVSVAPWLFDAANYLSTVGVAITVSAYLRRVD